MSFPPADVSQPSHEPVEKLSVFPKYLTLWVVLCILAGIALGRLLPGVAVALDAMSIYQVSIPIATCLFFMSLLPWSA